MSNPNGNANALLRLCCIITHADPDIAGQSNKFDQRTIIKNAAALIAVFALESVLWSAVLANRLAIGAAIALAMLIATFIYLIDQSIGAGDWELRGVLRERAPFSLDVGRRILRGLLLLSRVAMAIWLAFITGENVTLWWYAPTIDNHLQAKRSVQNARLKEEYDAHRDLAAQPLLTTQTELTATKEERANLQRRIQKALTARDEAVKRASDARVEMEREEHGLERTKGRGPRFHDAQRQVQEANYLLSVAEGNLSADQARLKDLEDRIAQLDHALAERGQEFEEKSRGVDDQLKHDPRYVPERVDYLGRALALQEMQEDPVTGWVATRDYWLYAIAIVILELTFILNTQVGAPASVYTLRLIARTRLEAHQVDAEFVRNSQNPDGLQSNEAPAPTQTGTGAGLQNPWTEGDADLGRDDTPSEAPLFDLPPARQTTNNDPPMPHSRPSTREVSEEERYEVIGGAPGERVSTAEALANTDRYWVNQDRPREIWDRRHRDALLGLSYDKAA